MIQFACPTCQKVYKVSEEYSGRQTKCRACGQAVRIPAPASAAPLSAMPAAEPSLPSEPEDDQPLPWARWLAECRQRFGAAPRRFDEKTQSHLRLAGGAIFGLLFWIPLCKLLKNSRQRSIFRRGQVVWGHVIQANGVLWSPSPSAVPGREDEDGAPGELVFAADGSGQVTPEYLALIAQNLAALRGQKMADAELTRIGDYLEAETVRAFGWSVPQRISPQVPCYISTTLFVRKHLPDGYLQHAFFPIVISHRPPYYAMPLPARFWSPELLAWWTSR